MQNMSSANTSYDLGEYHIVPQRISHTISAYLIGALPSDVQRVGGAEHARPAAAVKPLYTE